MRRCCWATACTAPIGSWPSKPHGSRQGKNSWDRIGYGGPAPPPGHGVHHYHFKLYALDSRLQGLSAATKADVLAAMQGHVLAEAQIVGTYEKAG